MHHRFWPIRLGFTLESLAIVVLVTSVMAAPSPSDKATAKALFDAGKQHMIEKKYAAACEKFEESNHLDPALGTLLNLGDCYEKDGRTMSAWTTFLAAGDAAKAAAQADRVKYAKERSTALEKRLVKISIVVSADVVGLVIKRDGAIVTKSQLGVAVAVDPGGHTIEASAPGRQTVEMKVTVTEEGQTKTVTIPALELVKPPPMPSASTSTAPTSPGFDKSAAAAALKNVPYKDCGGGGAGTVSITFAPTGMVTSATVVAGNYETSTKTCVAARFKAAKVPPFAGDPKTVGWAIDLPGGATSPSPTPPTAPTPAPSTWFCAQYDANRSTCFRSLGACKDSSDDTPCAARKSVACVVKLKGVELDAATAAQKGYCHVTMAHCLKTAGQVPAPADCGWRE